MNETPETRLDPFVFRVTFDATAEADGPVSHRLHAVAMTMAEVIQRYPQAEAVECVGWVHRRQILAWCDSARGGGKVKPMRPGDQPPPTPNEGADVWPRVVEFVRDMWRMEGTADTKRHYEIIADMEARDRLGRERYGTPLQAFNGRDALRDLYEELLDALAYMSQALMEGRHSATLGPMHRGAIEMLEAVRALLNERNAGLDVDEWAGFVPGGPLPEPMTDEERAHAAERIHADWMARRAAIGPRVTDADRAALAEVDEMLRGTDALLKRIREEYGI